MDMSPKQKTVLLLLLATILVTIIIVSSMMLANQDLSNLENPLDDDSGGRPWPPPSNLKCEADFDATSISINDEECNSNPLLLLNGMTIAKKL